MATRAGQVPSQGHDTAAGTEVIFCHLHHWKQRDAVPSKRAGNVMAHHFRSAPFDPTVPVEKIQEAYERVYHAAFPELRAVLEYEIRMRGVEPRPPSEPPKGLRRSARVLRRPHENYYKASGAERDKQDRNM